MGATRVAPIAMIAVPIKHITGALYIIRISMMIMVAKSMAYVAMMGYKEYTITSIKSIL